MNLKYQFKAKRQDVSGESPQAGTGFYVESRFSAVLRAVRSARV